MAIGRWSGGLVDEPMWGKAAKLAELDAIVQAVAPDAYADSPLAALEQVLAEAAKHTREDQANFSQITFRRGISLLFRVGDDLPVLEPGGNQYGRLVRLLAQEAGLPIVPGSQKTQRRPRDDLTAALRAEMAVALLRQVQARCTEQGPCQCDPSEEPPSNPPIWVPRPELQQRVDAVVESRRDMPLLLWGESGNGKTWIARYLVDRHFADSKPIWIRGPVGPHAPFFDTDIVAALQAKGVPCESWDKPARELKFAELIRTPGGFDIVVFDNVDPSIVERLCTDAAVPVIATSREAFPTNVGTVLRVGEFTRDEAEQLCRRMLPREDHEQLCQLFTDLGFRPIALNLACRLVAAGYVDLAGLLRSFFTALPQTLTAAVELLDESIDRNLLQVYNRILESLREHPVAMHILRTIVWWTSSNSMLSLKAAFRSFNGAQSDILLRGALRTLQSRGLVEVTEDTVIINTLTEDILRALTRDAKIDQLHDDLFNLIVMPPLALVDKYVAASLPLDRLLGALLTPPHDLEGFKFGYRFQVVAGALALSTINAHRHIGVLQLSANMWFVWQDGIEFFEAPTSRRQYAIMIIKPSGITLWGTGIEGRVSPQANAIGLIMASILFQGEENLIAHCSGIIAFSEPKWLRVISHRADAAFHHIGQPVGVPEGTLSRLDRHIWALCGALYSPKEQVLNTKPICDSCEQASQHPLKSTVTNHFVWLLTLIRRLGERAKWSVAHDLNAMLASTLHPSHLAYREPILEEALSHAKRGEANGDPLAAISILWTQNWLHELAIQRKDVHTALIIEVDILHRIDQNTGITAEDEPAIICYELASHWKSTNPKRELELIQKAIQSLTGSDINLSLMTALQERLVVINGHRPSGA